MKIPFYKCNSKGNSFIIIFPSRNIALTPNQIQHICNLSNDNRVDGLIYLDILDDSNIVMYILVSRTVIAFAKLLIVCKQSKVYHCRLGAIYVEGISGDVLR